MEKPGRAETIAATLAHAIHEHRLPPGAKLSEDEVGEIFGVSRTVVRAALQRLSHGRLVELRPNYGAFVAQPSLREAREVFDTRCLLEPSTARAAAERITPADLDILERHIADEHDALDKGMTGRALYLSGKFHVEIARIADQAIVAEFISQLVARSSLVVTLYWQRRDALCESHAHHALLRALEDRDGRRAETLMNQHLMSLMASLDLREHNALPASLREALGA